MVWIAGDSVLADWDDKAVGMEKRSLISKPPSFTPAKP